jgi:hypothetical protein
MGEDVAYRMAAQSMQMEGMYTDEFRSHLSFVLSQDGSFDDAVSSFGSRQILTDEYRELKQAQSDSFLHYDEYDAIADSWASKYGTNYAAVTRDMQKTANKERANNTSGPLSLDSGAGTSDASIALGRYYQELDGGYYDLQSGFDFSKQSVAWLAEQKRYPQMTNAEGKTIISDIFKKDGTGQVGITTYEIFIQWQTFASMDAPEKTDAEMYELKRLAYEANGAEGEARSMQISRMHDTFYDMFNTGVDAELALMDAPALIAGIARGLAKNAAKTGIEAAASEANLATRTATGLGDVTTSPWLADTRAAIPSHIEMFRDGGSYLVPESAYVRFVQGQATIGRTDGLFMTTTEYMDNLLLQTGGDLSKINSKLGVNWTEQLYRIDVQSPLLYNARLPSGLESGANSTFKWGGYTKGGAPEIITTPVPSTEIKITPVKPTPSSATLPPAPPPPTN